MNDLFTINLLIFQNPSSLCHKPSVLQGLFSCPFIVFFSCWLTGLGNGCSHFPLCVMKRQHFYTSEFYFTLRFQGNTVSFSCQQTLTFRSQLSDACKIHFCQLYRFKNVPNNKSIHFCGFNRSYFGLWLMDFNPFLFVFFLLPVGLYCLAFFLCV